TRGARGRAMSVGQSGGQQRAPGLQLTWGSLGFVYLAIGTLLWLILVLVQPATLIIYTIPGSCFGVAIVFFVVHIRLTTPKLSISTRGSTAEKLKSGAAVVAIAAPLLTIPANIVAARLMSQASRPPITESKVCPAAPASPAEAGQGGGAQLN